MIFEENENIFHEKITFRVFSTSPTYLTIGEVKRRPLTPFPTNLWNLRRFRPRREKLCFAVVYQRFWGGISHKLAFGPAFLKSTPPATS